MKQMKKEKEQKRQTQHDQVEGKSFTSVREDIQMRTIAGSSNGNSNNNNGNGKEPVSAISSGQFSPESIMPIRQRKKSGYRKLWDSFKTKTVQSGWTPRRFDHTARLSLVVCGMIWIIYYCLGVHYEFLLDQ